MHPTHPIEISDFGFRISDFRNRLGKRSASTGGAWHPDSPRTGVPGILSGKTLGNGPRPAEVPGIPT